jgi:hypothetical protein
VTDEYVPFCLGIVDGLVQIGVEDDEGVPRALAESSSDELREWARERFEDTSRRPVRFRDRRWNWSSEIDLEVGFNRAVIVVPMGGRRMGV